MCCVVIVLTPSFFVKTNLQDPFPPASEIKVPTLDHQNGLASEHDQLQAKLKELSTATEKLAQKDAELQQKVKELSNMSEILQKKDKELTELKLSASEVSKIKSELDQANVTVASLGKKTNVMCIL